MKKIKISTVSGSSVEKPLVTAFKTNNGSYVVLDNEINGTMGLPIILVSKYNNDRLGMMSDEEWPAVKESLRMIINGNQFDYIALPDALAAEDSFFKQLTLPVASFEALKNAYKPIDNSGNGIAANPEVMASAPVSPVGPMETVMPQESIPSIPGINENVTPVTPSLDQATTINPQVEKTVSPVSEPVVPTTTVAAPSFVVPNAPVQNQSVAPVAPVNPPEMVEAPPSVEPIPTTVDEAPIDFTADKEAFLKACENMFDALVAKFKN